MPRQPDDQDPANADTLTAGSGEEGAGVVPVGAFASVLPPGDQGALAALRVVGANEYKIGREIAHGGMGRILEAHDRRHDRRVALKLLRTATAGSIRRFLREARIAARLQHPAIVPVYEAGRWADGEPFFVMKLVEGRSLDAVIQASPTLDERLALLPHIIATTEALAYAHGQQIIHRDLKPANVLVGGFGETVVIDWGVAKDLADPGDDSGVPGAGSSGSSYPLTVAGSAMGTPAYMAPEQARGEPVDARADVYSLGALLYHVLGGRAPFAAALAGGVLAGPPLPIRSLVPDLPRDLATIVEKAMARSPADRYPTAAGMAADLTRFTSGQLVHAHSYGLATLLRRWIARHRAPVLSAIVLLVALVVGGAISVRRIVQERDRADRLAVLAIEERQAAESLVDFLIANLRKRLQQVGRLDLLSDVGERVDAYYRAVSPGGANADAAALGRWATVYETLAAVALERNDLTGQAPLLATALELRSQQVARAPGDASGLADLAAVHASIAAMERSRNRLDEWSKAHARAREVVERLRTLAPHHPRLPRLEALLASELCEADEVRGNFVSAGAACRQQLEWLRAAFAQAPEDEELERSIGDAWSRVSRMLFLQGRYRESEAASREMLAIYQRQLERQPDDAERRRRMAEAYFMLGESLRFTDPLKGAAVHAQGLEIRNALAAADPSNQKLQREVEQSRSNICRILTSAGQLEEARDHCRASMVLAERLAAAAGPEEWGLTRDLTIRHQENAQLDLELGELESALPHAEAEIERAELALKRNPSNQFFRHDAASGHVLAGEVKLKLGRRDEVAAHIAAARAHIRARSTESPWNGTPRPDRLAGDLALAQGDRAAALAAYRDALAGYERLLVSNGRSVVVPLAEVSLALAALLPPAERGPVLARARQALLDATRDMTPTPREQRMLEALRAAGG